MNKKERMYQQIENHGANLNAIFETGLDNVKLAKKFHSLEVKAHKLAEDYCNGVNGVTTDNFDEKCEPILKAVDKISNYTRKGVPVFVNGDARGYALKIEDSWTAGYNSKAEKRIYTDWGGYGILAPAFDGK